MGQQIKWQTLCELVSSLTRADVLKPDTEVAVRQVRFKSIAEHAPLGGEREIGEPFFLGRAEATLQMPGQPGASRDVHIYEAYWAPLTEGRITLIQTIRFLIDAALKGIRHSFRTIARYDGVSGVGDPPIVERPRPYHTVLWLFGLLPILFSVIAMNLAITVAQVQRLLTESGGVTRSLLAALTGDLWTFELILLGAFLAFRGTLTWRSRVRQHSSSWHLPAVASWTLMGRGRIRGGGVCRDRPLRHSRALLDTSGSTAVHTWSTRILTAPLAGGHRPASDRRTLHTRQ